MVAGIVGCTFKWTCKGAEDEGGEGSCFDDAAPSPSASGGPPQTRSALHRSASLCLHPAAMRPNKEGAAVAGDTRVGAPARRPTAFAGELSFGWRTCGRDRVVGRI